MSDEIQCECTDDGLCCGCCVEFPHRYTNGTPGFFSAVCQNPGCNTMGTGDRCGDGECYASPAYRESLRLRVREALRDDPYYLNKIAEFDHAFRVLEDGTVESIDNVFAPTLCDDEIVDSWRWELVDGYSGQHGYGGPIMHDSEFLGGGMAIDVLMTPGIYVCLVSRYTTDPNGEPCDDEPYTEGWALARLKED